MLLPLFPSTDDNSCCTHKTTCCTRQVVHVVHTGLRKLLPNKKAASTFPLLMQDGDQIASAHKQSAELFNNFFVNIGNNLINNIKSASKPTSFLKNRVPSSFVLFSTTAVEISQEITRLKVKKSTNYDEIPSFFLKTAANVIAPYLALLIDFMFTNGVFPDSLKIAKVVPIYKSGLKSQVQNYRPIALLSPFSKVIEKLLKVRILSFSNRNNVLYARQSGFRTKQTTMFSLIDVITACYENINDKKYSSIIALNIKNAFDCVNHEVLLQKLDHYGFRGTSQKLRSYLSNRRQYVQIKNFSSSLKQTGVGVPQGSVLRPLFFLIYINDLPACLDNPPKLFADDTCLLYSSYDLHMLEEQSAIVS